MLQSTRLTFQMACMWCAACLCVCFAFSADSQCLPSLGCGSLQTIGWGGAGLAFFAVAYCDTGQVAHWRQEAGEAHGSRFL